MCDYSLDTVKTRPAQVGDKLTTRLFETGTRGFCAPEDASVAVCLLPVLSCPSRKKSGVCVHGAGVGARSNIGLPSSVRSTEKSQPVTMTRWNSQMVRSSC